MKYFEAFKFLNVAENTPLERNYFMHFNILSDLKLLGSSNPEDQAARQAVIDSLSQKAHEFLTSKLG